jgi:hypothetical protein
MRLTCGSTKIYCQYRLDSQVVMQYRYYQNALDSI